MLSLFCSWQSFVCAHAGFSMSCRVVLISRLLVIRFLNFVMLYNATYVVIVKRIDLR
jgi:hypothetical protein